jgi:hypothetical protein
MLAHAASDHLRVLLELFSHAAWITGAGGMDVPMTPRARAICVELGMATALVQELELLERKVGIAFPAGYVSDKRFLTKHFGRLHAKHGCACHGNGRSHTAVRATLRSLNAVIDDQSLAMAKLLYGLWITSSRAIHLPRLEHLAADAPGGAAISPATIPDRAITLYNLVLVESYIAGFAATPFVDLRRQIEWSAVFLLDKIKARTEGSKGIG